MSETTPGELDRADSDRADTIPVFDGHNDTLLKLEIAAARGTPRDFAAEGRDLHIDLPRARRNGFAGGFFAMYTPSRVDRLGEDYDRTDSMNFAPVAQDRALAFTMALFARMRRIAKALPDEVSICRGAPDIRKAMEAGKLAILPHIEGAECIDTDFNALEVLHAAGLRSLGLVWSRPNAFGDGVPMKLLREPDPGNGLTDAGKALVRACEELGIMVDLSHLTEAGFWDVAGQSTRPLVATHSNAHAVSPNTRNLTDNQLSAIAESGGVVGLNFCCAFLREDCRDDSDTPITTMLRHIDHLLSILGEEGVALGSDYDGCLTPAEIGGVEGLPRLTAAMRQAGYGEELIAKICHRNWVDLLARVGV